MIYKVTLNNKVYEVEVEEDSAMLIDEYEAKIPVAQPQVAAPVVKSASAPVAQPTAAVDGTKITSPLPGTVVKIAVSANQTVKKGEVLTVVEAMKMENEIMAPNDGTVKQIVVKVGDKVETGSLLLVI